MARDRRRDVARQAVSAQMADRGWNPTDLARLAKVDTDTITTFLSSEADKQRWPKIGTQGKIERALGWEPGTITAIAASGEPPALRSGRSEVDLIRELAARLPPAMRTELVRYATYLDDTANRHANG
jgi:lambda repressor-like predicted transcriptional regulator